MNQNNYIELSEVLQRALANRPDLQQAFRNLIGVSVNDLTPKGSAWEKRKAEAGRRFRIKMMQKIQP